MTEKYFCSSSFSCRARKIQKKDSMKRHKYHFERLRTNSVSSSCHRLSQRLSEERFQAESTRLTRKSLRDSEFQGDRERESDSAGLTGLLDSRILKTVERLRLLLEEKSRLQDNSKRISIMHNHKTWLARSRKLREGLRKPKKE